MNDIAERTAIAVEQDRIIETKSAEQQCLFRDYAVDAMKRRQNRKRRSI